jgi:hypothetical protein
LVAVGGAAAVVLWLLPWYVRHKCVETAAAHGIALEVDGAEMTMSGFRLLGVRATAAAVPEARAQAPEVDVETSGLRPQRMTIRRGELALRGPVSAVQGGLSRWRASPAGTPEGDWMPQVLVAEESRVVWQSPVGDGVELQAADTHVEIDWHSQAAELHLRSARVTVAVPGGTLGPWRMDLDRTASLRFRVALDPAAPDACTVLVVGNDERVTSVDVVVPRSPFARLGIPAELVGLRGSPQVETTLHYAARPQHADLNARGALYSIDAGLPAPLGVSWEAGASGDPGVGIDLTKARLAVGPLVGTLAGTLKTYDGGFRVDLAWSAGPVPCRAFEDAAAARPTTDTPGGPLDLAAELRKLAQGAGVADVRGDVSARGSLALDTRDLRSARVSFTPEAHCQLSLFGR